MRRKIMSQGRPITKDQVKLIKIAQRDLGLDDETYREMLRANFGVTSCTQLTVEQATALVELFESRGFKVKAGVNDGEKPRRKGEAGKGQRSRISREGGKVVRLAGAEERRKISVLAGLVEWKFEDGLQRWMQARFKIEKVRTAREAWLVIEGLKKMFEGRMRREHGEDWWTKQLDDPRMMRYIAEHCPVGYRT